MLKQISIIIIFCSTLFAQYERIEYSIHSDTVPVNNVTTERIDSVFNFIYSQSWLIDFEDCNICKSRAHIICRIIEKQFPGISVSKAWVIADCKRHSMKDIYRYKTEVFLSYPGKCSNWSYHVAPVIITETDTFIIDPATQKRAVKFNKWADDIIPENGKGFLIIKDDRYYIYPESSNDYFIDDIHYWDVYDHSITDDKYLRSVDETLMAKHRFYEPWKFNYYVSKLMELLE